MIQTASKYGTLRRQGYGGQGARGVERGAKSVTRTPGVLVPSITGARLLLRDWYWREIKDGGCLDAYLKREKGQMPHMMRRVARLMANFQQNNQSDFRRLCTVPARLYQRWKLEDAHFWEDDNNLRSLKRDNPDLPIFVKGSGLKGRRYHYGQAGPHASSFAKASAFAKATADETEGRKEDGAARQHRPTGT